MQTRIELIDYFYISRLCFLCNSNSNNIPFSSENETYSWYKNIHILYTKYGIQKHFDVMNHLNFTLLYARLYKYFTHYAQLIDWKVLNQTAGNFMLLKVISLKKINLRTKSNKLILWSNGRLGCRLHEYRDMEIIIKCVCKGAVAEITWYESSKHGEIQVSFNHT